jgi:hypothetical protein
MRNTEASMDLSNQTAHPIPTLASFALKEPQQWDSLGPRKVYVQDNDRFTMFALQPAAPLIPAACFNSSPENCYKTIGAESYRLKEKRRSGIFKPVEETDVSDTL